MILAVSTIIGAGSVLGSTEITNTRWMSLARIPLIVAGMQFQGDAESLHLRRLSASLGDGGLAGQVQPALRSVFSLAPRTAVICARSAVPPTTTTSLSACAERSPAIQHAIARCDHRRYCDPGLHHVLCTVVV